MGRFRETASRLESGCFQLWTSWQKLEIVEKNVSENHNPLPQKHTSEVLLSKAAPSPSGVYDETRLWC